jgi:hypothetical protein
MKPREIRFLHRQRPSTTGSQLARDHYASHQQMNAENRLQQLEVIRPKENIDLLNAKFRILQNPRHARPILPQYRDDYVNTLYDQMGTYVQERAGLYHTVAYEPAALAQAIPELEQQANHPTRTEADFQDERNLDELLNRAEQSLYTDEEEEASFNRLRQTWREKEHGSLQRVEKRLKQIEIIVTGKWYLSDSMPRIERIKYA